MSKWIVGVMMLVVLAMFWKGVEVLGPSNTNKDILYEGPKKSVPVSYTHLTLPTKA